MCEILKVNRRGALKGIKVGTLSYLAILTDASTTKIHDLLHMNMSKTSIRTDVIGYVEFWGLPPFFLANSGINVNIEVGKPFNLR